MAIIIVLMLIGVNLVGAAHIFGTVFDENIQPANKAVVQINTTPEQQFITLNGTYSFEVAPGSYRLLAVGQNASAEKNVTIFLSGDFHIDLILLPGVPAEDSVLTDLLSAPEIEPPNVVPTNGFDLVWLIVAALIVALGAWAYLNRQRFFLGKQGGQQKATPRKDTPANRDPLPAVSVPGRILTADQQKVMLTLTSFNNRASQKELRRALDHWSEAKVSMELTELEELGAIQKLKKGRGNIIRKV